MLIHIFTSSLLSYILIKFIFSSIRKGKDMHKREDKHIPECTGIAVLISYLVHLRLKNLLNEKLIVAFYISLIDDFIEITWNEKILLPCILAQNEFSLVRMDLFSYLYRLILTIFSCNCINILSGVNGIEITQVIAILTSLATLKNTDTTLIILFLSSSLPLLYLNLYPSKVFIGNAYLFFAGYLVVFIESRLVLLLYGLQIVNFLISLPQLLGFYYCPRHRMPGFDGEFLRPSYFLGKKVNMTLLNYLLVFLGPINEGVFCNLFLWLQVAYCALTIFFIRLFNLE